MAATAPPLLAAFAHDEGVDSEKRLIVLMLDAKTNSVILLRRIGQLPLEAGSRPVRVARKRRTALSGRQMVFRYARAHLRAGII